MTVVVALTAPVESVEMAETLAAVPETVIEIERVADYPTDPATPYFWASGGDGGDYEASLSRRLRRAHGALASNALPIPEPIPNAWPPNDRFARSGV